MEQDSFTIRYKLKGKWVVKTFDTKKQLDNFVRENEISEYYDKKGTLHIWII